MDVALHDNLIYLINPIIIDNKILKNPKLLLKQELDAFTIGLIDGDGSLQVNH
jgi:hypothetical protein